MENDLSHKERHPNADPGHRRATRPGPRVQRLQLRRRGGRARDHQGRPALPLPGQGGAGRGAGGPLRRTGSPQSWSEIDADRLAPPARLAAYARRYAGVLREKRMCLCGMLAAEYDTLPPPMRDAILGFFDRNGAWLRTVIEDGRTDRSMSFDGTAEDGAQTILGGLEEAQCSSRGPTATSPGSRRWRLGSSPASPARTDVAAAARSESGRQGSMAATISGPRLTWSASGDAASAPTRYLVKFHTAGRVGWRASRPQRTVAARHALGEEHAVVALQNADLSRSQSCRRIAEGSRAAEAAVA